MKTPILAFFCALSTAFLASGQVPSLINYQGRLTDANGAAVTGSKNFAINIFDAATGGNLLYSETIGAVTLDSNGVYSFQFGSAGTSNKQVTETIGTTAGTTLVYSKALANSSVVSNSITVTDGTNSWSQSVGNPGAGATATANTIVGFVIGATITNGGSGYTSAPTVTISGNGTGASATATLTDGVVTGITIVSAGSGYTTGATITIAPPVIPFRVEYASGTITATYASAPPAGRTIAATYRYGTGGIVEALQNANEHWIAITVDGVTQGTRQRVLAVPFANLAKNVAPEVVTGITSSTRAELDSVYSMLAGFVLAKEVTSSRQSYSGNSQIEIFDNSDGRYDCVVSTNGNKTASGIYANRIIQLGTFAQGTSPGTVTHPINDMIRYVEFNSSLVAGVQTSVLFSYEDGSTSLIEKPGFSPNQGITFRYGNPNPAKIVSSITRYASDLRGAITDSYASLSTTEIVIKCSTVIQQATSLSVAAQSSRLNAKNVFSWKVFNSSNFQVAESGGPTISVTNGANIGTIMLRITPEITGSETDCDLIQGVSFVKIR